MRQLGLFGLAIGLTTVSAAALAAEPGKTLEVKLGETIARTWDEVKKADYAYGPKQEFEADTKETHIWLPYGTKGVYFETAGVRLTDPGPPEGCPLVLSADGNASGRLVFKLHFDEPISAFRFYAGWSEWGVGGDTVGGVEYSVDGRKWTPIRQINEAKAEGWIIEPFADGKKAVAGLNTQNLYIGCYSRDKKDPDAAFGPARWMKFRMGGDPAWGDVATTFFNCQLQLWVTPAGGVGAAPGKPAPGKLAGQESEVAEPGPAVKAVPPANADPRKPAAEVTAVPAADFLNSIGVCTHIGQGIDDPARCATALTYAGIRNLRDDVNPGRVPDWILVHKKSGVKIVFTCSGPDEAAMMRLIDASKRLAAAEALLALDGPNEPNNWAVTFEGQKSQADKTFIPVAKWQRAFYSKAKSDPVLKDYPVFHSSEAGGSEPDNVGLQFLTIPKGAGTLMPDGTKYADYANVHNYICRRPAIIDNMAWMYSDNYFSGLTTIRIPG